MREPNFQTDGWSLDDGESRHAAAPETFWIPDRQRRESLEPGDLAKLIFQISVDDGDENVAVERMWVLVRERIDGGYLGMLDNEPSAIAENDEFWLGTELPFSARHVINIEDRDDNTVGLARQEPRRRWPMEYLYPLLEGEGHSSIDSNWSNPTITRRATPARR